MAYPYKELRDYLKYDLRTNRGLPITDADKEDIDKLLAILKKQYSELIEHYVDLKINKPTKLK
jgi:hypothetical protein